MDKVIVRKTDVDVTRPHGGSPEWATMPSRFAIRPFAFGDAPRMVEIQQACLAVCTETGAFPAEFFYDSVLRRGATSSVPWMRRAISSVMRPFFRVPMLKSLRTHRNSEEDVAVPLRLLRLSHRARRARVMEMLGLVGLANRTHHRVYELSGGEQQRVAVARALVKYPSLLLADEPTGQLDSATGTAIIALLREIVTQTGITVVLATHDPKVMAAADRVFALKDGRLVGEQAAGP